MRDDIIGLLKKEFFRIKIMHLKQKKQNQKKNQNKNKNKNQKKNQKRAKKFIEYIENESNGINYELFKKHFNFVVPSALVNQLYETKK